MCLGNRCVEKTARPVCTPLLCRPPRRCIGDRQGHSTKQINVPIGNKFEFIQVRLHPSSSSSCMQRGQLPAAEQMPRVHVRAMRHTSIMYIPIRGLLY